MEAYFFVPGNRLHKVGSLLERYAPNIIVDLEDAVKESERENIVRELIYQGRFREHYIRIPLYDSKGVRINLLEGLLKAGYVNFVFPKINTVEEFANIYSQIKDYKIRIILLVETPELFLGLQELLTKYKSYFAGIGLGSHDFMAVVGGIHNLKNLEYARQHILYLARAFDILAIDIASMEVTDKSNLKNEIIDGFDKGYDAKFFIHPWQLDILNGIDFYSEEDYEWAIAIDKQLRRGGSLGEFDPIVINGQVFERPHLKRAEKILKYYKHEGK